MLITESRAPSYEQLRPLKPLTTPTFPVYAELANRLVVTEVHPDATVAHVLGTCSGYAYSDADTVAMIMARMGLNDNRCLQIAQFVDPMFISSTAFLIQSEDGRSLILCYRGTEPVSLINWLTDFDINPEKVPIAFPDAPGTFEVHGGFYRNVRATRHQVITALGVSVREKRTRRSLEAKQSADQATTQPPRARDDPTYLVPGPSATTDSQPAVSCLDLRSSPTPLHRRANATRGAE